MNTIAGYEIIREFSHRIRECEKIAHQVPQFRLKHYESTKRNNYPDIGRLMFFAPFSLGLDYRGDSGELRLLKAWCDYFKSYNTPFLIVRVSPTEVYLLKERRAGEEAKSR
jgi:hypothetical protein